MKRIFGLVPNVFFLGLVSLLNDVSGEMIFAIMPVFLTTVLGAPALILGFMEGFADALASILRILSGKFSDKIQKRKRLAVIGYSLSTATRGVLAVVGNFWQVFVLRAIDRIGKGFRDSPRDALIANSVPKEEVGFSFGYHRAMDAIGSAIGPALGIALLLLLKNNFRLIFLIGFAIGFLAIFTFVFVQEVAPGTVSAEAAKTKVFNFSLKEFSPRFKQYLLSLFVFGLGVMPISLMALKGSELRLGLTAIPAMYLIYVVSFMLFAIPFGKFSDRIGEERVILGGFGIALMAYWILAYAHTSLMIALGFAVFGLYSAMTDGVERALASKLVTQTQTASGQGFVSAATGFSSLLAGVIGGYLWTLYGSKIAFSYGAILMIIGLLAFVVNVNHSRTRAA